jgi:hypothetical protein
MGAGFVMEGVQSRVDGWSWSGRYATVAVLAMCGAALITMLEQQGLDRVKGRGVPGVVDARMIPNAFDQRLVEYLDEHGQHGAMLVADSGLPFLQARTGHPVMMPWVMPTFTMYMPELGPSIQNILRDIYGTPFGNSYEGADDPNRALIWREVWQERSVQEWRELGKRYAFKYVLAPKKVPLKLAAVLVGATDILYQVDEDSPAASTPSDGATTTP